MIHEHLRTAFEQLGATVTNLTDNQHRITIPGRKNSIYADEHGNLLTVRPDGTQVHNEYGSLLHQQLFNNPNTTFQDAEQIVSPYTFQHKRFHIYDTRAEDTKYPFLTISREGYHDHEDNKYKWFYLANIHNGKGRKNVSNLEVPGDSYLSEGDVHHIDAVFTEEAPPESLIDRLRENHPYLFEQGNEQYARIYTNIVLERPTKYSGISGFNEENAFHKAMSENPHEQTPYLAYADWLEENNRPGLAEFIRELVEYRNKRNDSLRQIHTDRGGPTGLVVNPDTNLLEEQGEYEPRPVLGTYSLANDITPEQLQHYLNTFHRNRIYATYHNKRFPSATTLQISLLDRNNPANYYIGSLVTHQNKAARILRNMANEGFFVDGLNYTPERINESETDQRRRDSTIQLLQDTQQDEPEQMQRKYTRVYNHIVLEEPRC